MELTVPNTWSSLQTLVCNLLYLLGTSEKHSLTLSLLRQGLVLKDLPVHQRGTPSREPENWHFLPYLPQVC